MNRPSGILKKRSESGEESNNDDKPSNVLHHGERQSLIEHPNFIAWRERENLTPGDVVLVNNSFVFRDVKTHKADEFLLLYLMTGPPALTSQLWETPVSMSTSMDFLMLNTGAGNGIRTRDPRLGKAMLYR